MNNNYDVKLSENEAFDDKEYNDKDRYEKEDKCEEDQYYEEEHGCKEKENCNDDHCCKCKCKKGEKGDKGEQGDKGEKGDKGEIGEIGERGERGEKGDKGDNGERGKRGKEGERGKRGHKGKRGKQGKNIGKSNVSICCASPDVYNFDKGIVFNKSLINGKDIEFIDGSDYILLRSDAIYFIRYTFTAYPMNSLNIISAALQLNGVDLCGGTATSTSVKCRGAQSISSGTIVNIDKSLESNKLKLVSKKNAKIVGENFTSIQIIRLN